MMVLWHSKAGVDDDDDDDDNDNEKNGVGE